MHHLALAKSSWTEIFWEFEYVADLLAGTNA